MTLPLNVLPGKPSSSQELGELTVHQGEMRNAPTPPKHPLSSHCVAVFGFLTSGRPSPSGLVQRGNQLHSLSSGQGSSSRLSLESEGRGSFTGGNRELSVHLAASVWKLPTGVVPPEDSPPRDLSSSLWASSKS